MRTGVRRTQWRCTCLQPLHACTEIRTVFQINQKSLVALVDTQSDVTAVLLFKLFIDASVTSGPGCFLFLFHIGAFQALGALEFDECYVFSDFFSANAKGRLTQFC